MKNKTLHRLLLFTALFWANSAFSPTEEKTRIFLIKHSTCTNKNPYDAPETGWGQVLPNFLPMP
ncbi:MAG: hypothetical protein U5M51_13920 [Emticicia sp.]|nr:hypothetical protein [Emticicia sp.]